MRSSSEAVPRVWGRVRWIQEADETRALQALQIPPQLVVGNTGRLALLGEGGLPLENGTQPLIAG
jgi:hypothetical protein